jgi:hypothetical protein
MSEGCAALVEEEGGQVASRQRRHPRCRRGGVVGGRANTARGVVKIVLHSPPSESLRR